MAEHAPARLDLTKLLAAVEDAPPFSAADVLGERLASELDAREVSFLIADFSGHALIRLRHAGSRAATRGQREENAERAPPRACKVKTPPRACRRAAARPGARSGRRRSCSTTARTAHGCSRR